MLGAPRLLYYGSGTALCEKIKFINGVRAVRKYARWNPILLLNLRFWDVFLYNVCGYEFTFEHLGN